MKCSTALWLSLDPEETTRLEELVGCFGPRLSPGAQNRVFVKNGSRIQILDMALIKDRKEWFYKLPKVQVSQGILQ